jgi:cobalt-zinc-cadmium efflux system outer membrane protein
MPRRAPLVLLLACAGCATVEVPQVGPGWTAPDAAKPLSREDCVRLATHDAPTAAAWRAKLLGAQAAARQAATIPNPTLSVGWENLGLHDSSVQTTLTLAESLAALVQRPGLSAAAEHELAATRADLLAERAKLAVETLHGYDELLASRRKAALAAEAVDVARRLRDASAKFVAVGEKASVEARRGEAEFEKARADEASAAADARAKELAFAFALGFDQPVPLTLRDGFRVAPEAPAESDLLAAAQSRPEVVASRERVAAQLERARLSARRLQFLPTVGGGPRREGEDNSAVVSLDVELPIFDRGDAAADSASAELLAAAAGVRRVVRQVGAEVTAARERAAAATAFVRDHARPLADARRVLREEFEKLFAAGESSFEDLVVARRDEIEARTALVEAELALSLASTDLAAATGRLDLPDDAR